MLKKNDRGATGQRGNLPQLIWGGTLAVCLALSGYVAWLVTGSYEEALRRARLHTRNTVELVEQHTARTLETVEVLLRTVNSEVGSLDPSAGARVETVIRDNSRSISYLRGVSVLDLTAGTADATYGAPSHAVDRAALELHAGAAAGQLVVHRPQKLDGTWVIGVSIAASGRDARPFAAVAHLDLSYFVDSFRAADTGRDGAVALFRDDSLMLARLPFEERVIGQALPGAVLFEQLSRADAGTYETDAPTDGTRRIISYRRSAKLPLISLVAVSKQEVIRREFVGEAVREVLFATVIAALLLGLASLLVRQIKRRESAEQGERLQSEVLRTTLENIDQGLLMVDAEGRVRVCNQRAIQLLDLPPSLFEQSPMFDDVVRHQLASGEYPVTLDPYRIWESARLFSGHTSYERTRPNGTVLDIRTVPLASGGAVRTYTDITARRRAENAVKDSEARYRLLAENARDIIMVTTPEGKRTYISAASRELLGYEPEELLRLSPADTMHPDDIPLLAANKARLLNGAEDQNSMTYRARHRDGRWIWVETRRRVVRDEHGNPVEMVSVIRDVTERQRQSDELRSAKETAERALEEARESSEAKSEFLAAMSHEIRTPLHSIIGFTELLLSEEQPAEHRRKLELIRGSGSALLSLVNDILDFSKIEAGQVVLDPHSFEIAAFFEAAAAMARGLAGNKDLQIVVKLDPALPRVVVGDSDRIRQVVLNLLNNAVKFTPAGSVTLEVRSQGTDPSGERLCIVVRDTGIGIPSDKREHLFERFTQVDSSISRRFGGTGLGLAISKRLVELMGGQIGFESELGVGSTFWVSLTLPRSEAVQGSASEASEFIAPGSGARVLLVEDVLINQEIARAILERGGHHVDLASDGAEAVTAAARTVYDVILMDIQMPVMDGITATQRIRELAGANGRVPIVAMTANVLPDQIEGFKAAGANDHLGKPFDKRELLDKVQRWSGQTAPAREPPAPAAQAQPGGRFDRETYEGLIAMIGRERAAMLLGRLEAHLTKWEGAILDDADCERVATRAHSIIASAGMRGFSELSVAARQLEDACRDGGATEAALSDFHAARDVAMVEIAALRESPPAVSETRRDARRVRV